MEKNMYYQAIVVAIALLLIAARGFYYVCHHAMHTLRGACIEGGALAKEFNTHP